MKVKCIVDDFPFNRLHVFDNICKFGSFYEGDLVDGTTHILFIDMPENAFNMIDELKYYISLGIKIVYSFYDPYRFDQMDRLISLGVVDEIILYDIRHKDRFSDRVSVIIMDYFLNESFFPEEKGIPIFDKCYFGHLLNRELDDKTTHLKINNYVELYKTIQLYKRVVVFDNGELPNGDVIYHNKAKFIESLMCGVPSNCGDNIITKRYNKYLSSDNIDISEIREINSITIMEFINLFKKK